MQYSNSPNYDLQMFRSLSLSFLRDRLLAYYGRKVCHETKTCACKSLHLKILKARNHVTMQFLFLIYRMSYIFVDNLAFLIFIALWFQFNNLVSCQTRDPMLLDGSQQLNVYRQNRRLVRLSFYSTINFSGYLSYP